MKDILEKYKAGELFKRQLLDSGCLFEVGDQWENIECGTVVIIESDIFLPRQNKRLKGDEFRVVKKSAAIDRLIAQQYKKTLHDVIDFKLGSDMKADFAVSTDAGKGFFFMSGKENGEVVICTKQEYNDYIADIERDYNQYKEDYLKRNNSIITGPIIITDAKLSTSFDGDSWKSVFSKDIPQTIEASKANNAEFEQKPLFTQAMKDKGELPAVGSSAEHLINGEPVVVEVIAHRIIGDLRVAVFAFDNGTDVESYSCSTASSFSPIKSPEEKLIDDIQNLLDSNIGASSTFIAKEIVKEYNITPKE